MKDEIIDCLAYNGKVSIKCISSREIVEKARKLHDLSPTASAALGRLLTITSIMGYELKTEEASITNQIKGNGPIGILTAVADSNGNVKGYVGNSKLDLPLRETDGKLDVGGAVGKQGMLYIIKDLGIGKPYVGMTPIVSGEIAEDFTNYFATSEQTPTVIALGVLVDKNGIKSAGGYKLSLMPDAGEEEISKIEEQIKNIEPVSRMLDENKTLEEIAKIVTGDENLKVLERTEPKFECNCSREKCEKGLIAIGKKEGSETAIICAKLESELSELDEEEKKLFLDDLGIKESGVERLINKTYDLLGLATFFTVGKDEVRAWTFKKGSKAPECAGIIHSDFEKGFIKAEVMSYNDLVNAGSELKVRELGKARIEGKEYIMQDGDICHFRFNV